MIGQGLGHGHGLGLGSVGYVSGPGLTEMEEMDYISCMKTVEDLIRAEPYSIPRSGKEGLLLGLLNKLTVSHLLACEAYRNIFRSLQLQRAPYAALEDIPYLPVSLFKTMDLMSIPKDQIYKTLLSSGTTGGTPSRIYLDQKTALLQMEGFASIMTHFLGDERLPMVIVESESLLKDPKMFSARGAALLGMLSFGRDHFYLLDNEGKIRYAAWEEWQKKHEGETLLVFGFTFILWSVLMNSTLRMPNAIAIHTGGWKRVEEISVTREQFKKGLSDRIGIAKCYNFYGMVEQTGSAYMECEEGRFHAPNFAEVIFRDPTTWKPSSEGVIEVLSAIPASYPGHVLLTEDLGRQIGVDDCPCGRMGTTFHVLGRVPKAEPRGCSDVGSD